MCRLAIPLFALLSSANVLADVPHIEVRNDTWSISVPVGCKGKVSTQQVAARPYALGKPDYYDMPAHVRFDLADCLNAPEGAFTAELMVFRVDEYLRIHGSGPESEGRMQENFAALARWIDGAPVRGEWPMFPIIPFLDGGCDVVAGQKRLSSGAGRGRRVLTQFSPDGWPINDRGLTYVFQGLSSDGQHYVLMTVPLRLQGLVDPYRATTHLGFRLRDIDHDVGRRKQYIAAAQAWLDRSLTSIKPSLALLDAIAMSVTHGSP